MTELLHNVEAPSDAELISRVRGGDVAAYGDLFSRHVGAANRLARQLVRGPDADDLVAEAFAKVLSVLQGGGGPDVAFRAYLLTAVRRLHVDRVRAGSKLQTTDDLSAFDPGIPFQDTAVAGFESGAAAKAFASLPERWQLVLWHLEVEGQKPADIAPLLGMSPNSVSALAYRAREGLRQAFLTMHLRDISETSCRWVNEHLGAYVRNGLSKRDTGKVQAHLDECRRCTAMYLELTEVNSNLSGIIAPLLLGGAATAYLSSTGGIGTGGLFALMGRARDAVAANATAATAGAVAAGVAAVAVVGITLAIGRHNQPVSGADRPMGTVSTAPATPGASAATNPAKKTSPAGPTPQPTQAALLPAGTSPDATQSPAALGAAPSGTASAGPGDQSSGQTGGGDPSGQSSGGASQQPSHGGSPTPTPTPTRPAPGPATVDVAVSVSFEGTGVDLEVSGSTGPPPSVKVDLHTPENVLFAKGTCGLPEPATSVTCSRSGLQSLVVPTQPASPNAGDGFHVVLPFLISDRTQPASATISVSVPDPGYRVSSVSYIGPSEYRYTPGVPPLPTVTLASLAESTHTVDEGGVDSYTVRAHVVGTPSTQTPVSFSLSTEPATDATFAAVQPDGCALSGTGVTCEGLGPDANVDLAVTMTDDTATQAAVGLSPSPGYSVQNAADPVDLAPGMKLHLSMPDAATASDKAPDTFPLDATVEGLKATKPAVSSVDLTRSGDGAFVDSETCSGSADSVTCSLGPDGQIHPVVKYIGDSSGTVTLTVVPPKPYENLGGANSHRVSLRAPLGVVATYSALGKEGTLLSIRVTGAAPGELSMSIEGMGESVDFLSGDCGVAERDKVAHCSADGPTTQGFDFLMNVQTGQYKKSSATVTDADGQVKTVDVAFDPTTGSESPAPTSGAGPRGRSQPPTGSGDAVSRPAAPPLAPVPSPVGRLAGHSSRAQNRPNPRASVRSLSPVEQLLAIKPSHWHDGRS